MKYCEDFAALLDPYIDGELSPEETARVREHLRSCDGCRAYVQAALTMRDAFPEAEDTEVPEGFAEGVMAAIRADAAPRKRRRPRWQKTLLPLAACCAVVILAVSGLPRSTDTAVRDTAEPRVAAEEAGEPAEAEMSGEEDASIADAQAEEAPPVAAATEGETASAAPTPETENGEAAAGAGPMPFALSAGPALTLTAEEAGTLLDGCTPTAQEDGTLAYELTASEYTALLEQLEQQGMTVAGAATAQEAETAGTVWVYVIPE